MEDPTPQQIAARAAAVRSLASPNKQLTRMRKAGTTVPTKPPSILVRLYTTDQRDRLKQKADEAEMSLNAYCLFLLLGDELWSKNEIPNTPLIMKDRRDPPQQSLSA